MSSAFNRSLFSQMPPSIVITEPVPRWKAWARDLLYVAALLLLSGVSFYVGVQYQRLQQARTPAQQAAVSADAATTLTPSATEPGPALAELAQPLSLDGLQVQSLNVTRDDTVPGQWRYEFVVNNEGRPYEGHFEFLVIGVQEGRPAQWTFPAENQRAGGPFRLRVARYLKTSGQIQLPSGLTPQSFALRLHEVSGVRASRGLVLTEPAHAQAVPRALSTQ